MKVAKSGRVNAERTSKENHKLKSYISGVLDLFLPLKNSGRALRSMAWTLQDKSQGVQRVPGKSRSLREGDLKGGAGEQG